MMIAPLPNRPPPHHRPAEDAPLLHAAAEAARHGRLRLGHRADPAPLAADRLPGGAVRDHGSVWGLLRDRGGFRAERARRGAVPRQGV